MDHNSSSRRASILVSAFALFLLPSLACGSSTPEVIPPTSEGAPQAGAQAEPTEAQQEPTSAPPTEPAPAGSSRSSPAPVGSQVKVGDITFSVTEVVSPADDIVRQGNMFNSTPVPGSHYLFAKITATCNLSADESCNLSGFEFSLIDSAGVVHDAEIFVAGVPGTFEAGDFFGGATKEGYLVFTAPEGDERLILKYEELFGGEAYLALQ